MALEIKRAEELVDPELEARWVRRREAWHAGVLQPVGVEEIVNGFSGRSPEVIREALGELDEEDLIQMREGRVDIAYPFSALPTPFAVELAGGRRRYACCAVDALGIAPLLGQRVHIRSRCYHCGEPLEGGAVRLGRSRKPRESWSGSGGEAEASGGSRPRSERRSTSSGRKSTCAHGERRIPTSPEPAPRSPRRSGSVSGFSGGS